jgi:hypothetical protein
MRTKHLVRLISRCGLSWLPNGPSSPRSPRQKRKSNARLSRGGIGKTGPRGASVSHIEPANQNTRRGSREGGWGGNSTRLTAAVHYRVRPCPGISGVEPSLSLNPRGVPGYAVVFAAVLSFPNDRQSPPLSDLPDSRFQSGNAM